jgi:biotin carboxylase
MRASPPEDRLFVILTAEGHGAVRGLATAAAREGLRPLIITAPLGQKRIEQWRASLGEVVVLADPFAPTRVAALVRQLDRPVAALTSRYDGLIVPAAEAAAALGLPHPELRGLKASHNKHAARVSLAQAGVRTVSSALISSPEDAVDAAERVGLPCVLKPLCGAASHLVKACASVSELRDAYRAAVRELRASDDGLYRARLEDPSGGREPIDPRTAMVAESLVRGVEYCADFVVVDGRVDPIVLCRKAYQRPSFYVRVMVTVDGRTRAAREVWRYVREASQALGLDNTSCHMEVSVDRRGPVMIEANTGRTGGQYFSTVARRRFGRDVYREAVRLALGTWRRSARRRDLDGATGLFVFFPRRPGVLRAIHGVEALRSDARLVQVDVDAGAGTTVPPDQQIYAVNALAKDCRGDEEFVELYRRLSRRLRFRYC